MATEWHYKKSGQKFGPISASELKAKAKSGELVDTDLIWKEGMSEWKQAGRIKGLFAAQVAPITKSIQSPPPIPKMASPKDRSEVVPKQSFLDTAKNAAQYAAKQAERTKLVNLTLPSMYRALGQHAYSSKDFREEFTELFNQLDQVQAQQSEISNRVQPTATTFGEKAKAVAGKGIQVAQSQKLSMAQSSLFSTLGKAVYEKHREASGPQTLVSPIAESLARVASLQEESRALSTQVGEFRFSRKPSAKSLFFHPAFILSSLIVFFPLGLFLIWKNSDWSKARKLRWAGGFACFILFAGFFGQKQNQTSRIELLATAENGEREQLKAEGGTNELLPGKQMSPKVEIQPKVEPEVSNYERIYGKETYLEQKAKEERNGGKLSPSMIVGGIPEDQQHLYNPVASPEQREKALKEERLRKEAAAEKAAQLAKAEQEKMEQIKQQRTKEEASTKKSAWSWFGGGQKITEDFLPHKVGSSANYEISIPGVGIKETFFSYNAAGQIHQTTKKMGGVFVNLHSSPDTRFLRDGFVGILSGGEYAGIIECLKIGATKDDNWKRDDVEYKVLSFGTFVSKYDNRSRITVSIQQILPPLPNGKTIESVLVYAQGLGLVRKDIIISPVGKSYWQLMEPGKDMNLTDAERAFYK